MNDNNLNNSNNLKPVNCGCGGEAEVHVMGHELTKAQYYINCERCDTRTWLYDTEAEAITAWNKAMGADKRSDLAITKGYWMATYDGLHCSICNYKLDTTAVPDICPCCGSEMKP